MFFEDEGRSLVYNFSARVRSHPPASIIKGEISPSVNQAMGRVRLRIRELAEQQGWSLQDVAEQSGVNYNTVKSYARRDDGMSMVDLVAVQKIARAFGVSIEDLMDVLEP